MDCKPGKHTAPYKTGNIFCAAAPVDSFSPFCYNKPIPMQTGEGETYAALSQKENACRKALLRDGYRYVVAGKYICVYRILGDTVYVYHIAHGASNYPLLFKRLLRDEKI